LHVADKCYVIIKLQTYQFLQSQLNTVILYNCSFPHHEVNEKRKTEKKKNIEFLQGILVTKKMITAAAFNRQQKNRYSPDSLHLHQPRPQVKTHSVVDTDPMHLWHHS